MVTEEDVAKLVVCGPDPERHVEMIERYAQAGYDHVYVHQIGSEQEAFIEFYEGEVMPRCAPLATA